MASAVRPRHGHDREDHCIPREEGPRDDCDESNFGIDQMLGMELPETYINYFGGKMSILGQMVANHGAENVPDLFDKDLGIVNIPAQYIFTKGNICLMSPGKLQAANEVEGGSEAISEIVAKLPF